MHELKLAAYVFGVIFVAELPDKTALAALVLATRHKPLPVFLGTSLALAVQSAVAVAAGSLFSLLPARAVHISAGVVFLASSLFMWIRKGDSQPNLKGGDARDEPPRTQSFWRAFGTVFGVVFIAEWGDLTQFATAAFAAKERAPLVVFLASTLALSAVAGIAVLVGNRAAKVLEPTVTQRVAAVVFAAIGVALIMGWL
ncbi:MAG: TMEM165/GDT1 family protein [Myxococcota bacterium]|nr:TMEM165/GDT1 family protein [Myxococcota bacterium]